MRRQPLMTPEDRKEIANNIQKRIDELTFPELANLSNKAKNQELKQIALKLEAYLKQYAQTENKINIITQKYNINNYKDQHEKNLALYILYKQFLTSNISQLLTDGYILIETLRKTFTSEEIIYEVGMNYSVSKNNRQLINKTISLAELLSYAKPEIQWRGIGMSAFKLRASANKSDFIQEYNRQKDLIEQQIYGLQSLYPKVREVILGSSKNHKANEGNMYEVYMNLKHAGYADHLPDRINPDELSADDIIEKYISVKSGIQSFVSGGDLGLSQFKLLSDAPSLATLNTIGRALKLILSYIYEGESADITIEHIKQNVFSDQFDKLSREGLEDLLKDVNEQLQLET